MANELNTSTIQVQVCYALADKVYLQDVSITATGVIQDAIVASGVLQQYPEIELATARVGIFGKLKALDSLLQQGDRVEIYRPLQAEPMESRRRRAAHKTGRKD
jgi:putative ubiquitin-RnfH superfamily antitoxin RatB of RatAB toxin-antitoxin module